MVNGNYSSNNLKEGRIVELDSNFEKQLEKFNKLYKSELQSMTIGDIERAINYYTPLSELCFEDEPNIVKLALVAIKREARRRFKL